MNISEADTSEADLLAMIDKLNADDNVHGIWCNCLPKHLNEDLVINRIAPSKDVDGSISRMWACLAGVRNQWCLVHLLGVY